jgi:UDP-N-acetylmuramyl pentapeptide phosphotransferase/UDP-N-acetylglucosamine-1-phosphate transferase
MSGSIDAWAVPLGLMTLAAALICAGFIVVLHSLLVRYALARPNARSSHKQPTPQGGGIAVVASLIVVIVGALVLSPSLFDQPYRLAVVLAATLGVAIVGITDDVRPLEVMPRLVLQTAAVVCVVAALPAELRVVPMVPWWLERVLIVLGGVWFVNLVNFMDGIDWITAAEVVPITAALGAFGAMGALPSGATAVALTLCGAMIGFAPFNRPIAKLFLGDVGSLPIGLLIGWLLAQLAGNGYLTAALLLPLYFLLDTGATLVRRLRNGEPITQAHRGHFYQRAVDGGMTVFQVVARVFILNVALTVLATATVLAPGRLTNVVLLASGCTLVAWLLRRFARANR